MKTLIPFTLAAALAASGFSHAQTAFSKPSGYVTLGNADSNPATPDVPADTDVTVSIPFERDSEFSGNVTGVSGNVLSFANAGFTANQFVSSVTPYQITITSGAQAGLIGVISANSATSITVGSVIVGSLSGVEVNGTAGFKISKAWTLGTFFPSTFPAGTNVLAYSGTAIGQNLPADLGFVWSGTAWIQIIGSGGNGSNTMIFPGESLVVRTGAQPINQFVVTGAVPLTTSRTVVSKLQANTPQDTRLSFTIAVDQPIENLQGAQAGDNLLAFNNSSVGKNKAAAEILVYSGTQWIGIAGVSGSQNGIYKLKAGHGYVLRRQGSAPIGDITYSLAPNYTSGL